MLGLLMRTQLIRIVPQLIYESEKRRHREKEISSKDLFAQAEISSEF